MDIRRPLKSQYHASLKTLRLAIEKCPDTMWNNSADGHAVFWRVAYHTLFYAHFYLQPDHLAFTPWSRHHPDAQCTGKIHHENNRDPHPCDPYTREDILEYWQACDDMVDAAVDKLDLDAPECGFPWYQMSKLEHQLLNIRHIQHHAAALSTRLRREAGIGVEWVGRVA